MLSITEHYWVLLSITEHYWALLRVDEYCWVLLSIAEHCWKLLRIAEYNWALLKIAQNYWELLSVAETHWNLTFMSFWILLCILFKTCLDTLYLGRDAVFPLLSREENAWRKCVKYTLCALTVAAMIVLFPFCHLYSNVICSPIPTITHLY